MRGVTEKWFWERMKGQEEEAQLSRLSEGDVG